MVDPEDCRIQAEKNPTIPACLCQGCKLQDDQRVEGATNIEKEHVWKRKVATVVVALCVRVRKLTEPLMGSQVKMFVSNAFAVNHTTQKTRTCMTTALKQSDHPKISHIFRVHVV